MAVRVVVHGNEILDQTTLEVKTCPTCGIRYAVPAEFMRIKDRDAGNWYCPNGDSLIFTKPETVRLRAQLDQAQADARFQRDEKYRALDRAAASERTAIALRGHLTRYRKRVANGVCPVAGCHRHFPNVQAHVETVHGKWLAEHPEVFDG